MFKTIQLFAFHGAFGSPNDFDFLKNKLPANTELHALSLLNLAQDGPNLRSLSNAAQTFVSSLDTSSHALRVLVGYSMGGRFALHVLLNSPALFHGALLCSTGIGLAEDHARMERQRKDAEWMKLLRTKGWNTFWEQWNAQDIFGKKSFKQQEPQNLDQHMKLFECWGLGRQADLSTRLHTLSCPAHVLHGELDLKYSALSKTISQNWGGACKVLSIPGAAHRVLSDAPDRISAATLDFLKTLQDSSR